jgi:hypothetical protein
MSMSQVSIGAAGSVNQSVDAIRESVQRLEALLPERDDSAAVLGFIEDDLREGLDALSDVEAHFTDIMDALRAPRVTPVRLLEVSEDYRVLKRIETLMLVVEQLRRRLGQAAGQLNQAHWA